MTNYKALCAELANHLQGRKDLECGWPGEDPEQDLLDRARAALAQPEPEVSPWPVPGDAEGLAEVFWGRYDQPEPEGVPEPTDEELESFLVEVACQNGNMYHADPMILARAVLTRYAHPTIKPVPVAERLPEVGDWVWHCYAGVRLWEHGIYNGRQFFIGDGPESQPATHWLPHHALPVPATH
jgi:hypothetical protein